jgi:DNA-3-methyladenine glycosylase
MATARIPNKTDPGKMNRASILPVSFYDRDALDVARDLLGMRLVREQNGERVSGIITETEAYRGREDLGCHAHSGKTKRNDVMFGPPGVAYVYFTYGMHWCLNFVTGSDGFPAAVLIRAVEPLEGLELIAARRAGRKCEIWCDGPAKLTKAFGITGAQNGVSVYNGESGLFVEEGESAREDKILATPRIGLNNVPEPWRSMPWRFTTRKG